MDKIIKASLRCTGEPLRRPFGFKGGYLTELWQVTAMLETEAAHASGYGVQSVLWSDAGVFGDLGQDMGNDCMLRTTRFALERLLGADLKSPPDMISDIFPEVMEYARAITGRRNLRRTFALNALTPVDWALWRLWAQTREDSSFESVTGDFTDRLSSRQSRLGSIPLISYNTGREEIAALAKEGRFLFKVKIGADPHSNGDREEMLRWDMERLTQIHSILKDVETPWTQCGHPMYYLDANGRYDTLPRLARLLDHAELIGALDRVAILEEPFPEDGLIDVSDLPVTVAGDESAHSSADAVRLIEEYGYRAMALKPIAKTLSVSLEVLQAAEDRGAACFCADLTVPPRMAEENKLFAAHLTPLPGLLTGVFETNGEQNYKNWEALRGLDPADGRSWSSARGGVYTLSDEFYREDGGVWLERRKSYGA